LRNYADHEFVDTFTKLAEADMFDSNRDARRQLAIETTQKAITKSIMIGNISSSIKLILVFRF